MNIGMPCAAYHSGNPADYLSKSFERLGHTVTILNQWELETAVRKHANDLYIAVDSGGPLNLVSAVYNVDPETFKRFAFWFIDYRHNKHRPPHERQPNDEANAKLIQSLGGWVFQAQMQDVTDCWAGGISKCSWLPLAADPDVWLDHSGDETVYDVAFIGNVWDPVRAGALQSIYTSGLKFAYNTGGHIWKQAAAEYIGAAKMGFNISTFYGTPYAYDVNMRVFETLCCGVPLVTNWVPDLEKFFPEGTEFVRTFMGEHQVLPTIKAALNDEVFLNSRKAAREWVLLNGTYDLRATQIQEALSNVGIWPEQTTALEAKNESVSSLSE